METKLAGLPAQYFFIRYHGGRVYCKCTLIIPFSRPTPRSSEHQNSILLTGSKRQGQWASESVLDKVEGGLLFLLVGYDRIGNTPHARR